MNQPTIATARCPNLRGHPTYCGTRPPAVRHPRLMTTIEYRFMGSEEIQVKTCVSAYRTMALAELRQQGAVILSIK